VDAGGSTVAYIRKRGSRWQVRWRDPDGQQRNKTCSDLRTAQRLRRDIEQTVELGLRWEEPDRDPAKALEEVIDAWLIDSQRTKRASTHQQRAIALTLFCEWMKTQSARRRVDLSALKRSVLESYYNHLINERKVSRLTANDRIRHISKFWRWAYDHDDYPETPRPRSIELPEAHPALAPVAPDWVQMDEAIEAAGAGWYRDLFLVLRFTGLRRSQAMALLWSDFDLQNQTLTIRPELGKTRQERRGRVIPVSNHLIEEISGWGRREGFLIDVTKKAAPWGRTKRNREVHNGQVKAIWRRTSAPEDRYRQPCHCFRKGFISELIKAGAKEYAVKRLVGHSGGVTFDVYATPAALEAEMRAAVGGIPAVGTSRGQVLALTAGEVRERSGVVPGATPGVRS